MKNSNLFNKMLACLAITGAIRGTSSEKLYQELGLESLKLRCWFRKLCHFYEMLNEKSPSYLVFDLIPDLNRVREMRYSNNITAVHARHNYFKSSFFPSTFLNGKILIPKLETQEVSQFLKRTCLLTLYNLMQIVYLISITGMESNS